MTTENEQIRQIYEAYPRHKAPRDAIRAIEKAVAYIVKADQITPLEARRKLYKATLLYARSPEGQNPDRSKIPYPATWYNRESYLEDPQEWQHIIGGFTNGALSTGKANSNLAVLQRAIDRRKRNGSHDEDGLFPTSEDGRCVVRVLHGGARSS